MLTLTKEELRRIRKEEFCKGVREGERRTQRLLKQMSIVNHELWELVNLIDIKYPLAGVTIGFAMAEHIIKGLRSPRAHRKLAGQLKNIVRSCNRQLGQAESENQTGALA